MFKRSRNLWTIHYTIFVIFAHVEALGRSYGRFLKEMETGTVKSGYLLRDIASTGSETFGRTNAAARAISHRGGAAPHGKGVGGRGWSDISGCGREVSPYLSVLNASQSARGERMEDSQVIQTRVPPRRN